MYLTTIQFENYGPLEKLYLNPEFNLNGSPKPLVVIGKNGSGKTLFLSNILDGLIELKRKKYSSLLEVEENQYLKLGKKNYISTSKNYSYVELEFSQNSEKATFIDLMTNLEYSQFINQFSNLNLKGSKNERFQKNGFYKDFISTSETFLNTFETEIISYFPHSRYDHPAWLNKKTKLGFSMKENFIEVSTKNIIKNDVINDIEVWILDCLLDREIYEQQKISLPNIPLPLFGGYNGKNNDIINLINEILKIIYKSKFPNIEYARIGIGAKNRRSISIHIKENGVEKVVAPSFSHISSGESMLLSLFTTLLKEYDSLGQSVRNLNDVKGIVIIDEIDLHLHIEFQKSILPELLKRFSNVQFILSSHSPFFLHGMQETFDLNWNLFNLPFGDKIDINDFSEMKIAYEIFVDGFNNIQNTLRNVNEKLKHLSKPLVITEGKTDWKHIKSALSKFKNSNEYQNLDFDFLEYENELEMGDSQLKSLCEQASKLRNNRKIICIFDRDDKKIIDTMSGQESIGYKDWGNSVYSFCIPKPNGRENYNNISIEFYYTDNEIKTVCPINNTTLLFTNEIEEHIIKSKTNKGKVTSIVKVLENPKLEEENDKKIYCEDVSEIKNNNGDLIAHSKTVFADKIYNNEEGFTSFDMTNFKIIIDKIEHILNM